MNSVDDVLKVCPKCRQQDMTSFSTCRYCSTKYDARPEIKSSGFGFDERYMGFFALCALLIGTFFVLNAAMKKEANEQMKPVVANIQMMNRPRVIEFYANWCGPCRRYGPIVDACAARYSDKVDFQRLNVDDPKNRELAQAMQVRAIPRTCIFDREGKEIASFTGAASARELDEYVQKILPN